MKKLYLVILLLANSLIHAKILIYTFACNRPDFIEIQYITFTKFLKEEFELVVFNDAREEGMKQEIDSMCKKYDIDCISIPQEIHTRPYLNRPPKPYLNRPENPEDPVCVQFWENPADKDAAVRNCNVAQYALDAHGFNHDDLLILIDSHLFLIREFSLRDFMQDHNAASYMRSWVHAPFFYYDGDSPYDGAGFSYFWIGLIFLDMQSLPNKYALNLNRGIVSTPFGSGFTDAGGYSYYLLEYTKDLNPKPIHRLCFKDVICENC